MCQRTVFGIIGPAAAWYHGAGRHYLRILPHVLKRAALLDPCCADHQPQDGFGAVFSLNYLPTDRAEGGGGHWALAGMVQC